MSLINNYFSQYYHNFDRQKAEMMRDVNLFDYEMVSFEG